MDELDNKQYLAFEEDIPTKISELVNDSEYVKKDVNNLTNYYQKTEIDENIPFKFGIDQDGKYGYIKAGADTVTPFKNPEGTKTITENGEYDVSDFANASVNISESGGVTPSGTKSITSNGVYDVTDYASANVNVSTDTMHTRTYSPEPNISKNDMGLIHTYRYVDTSGMIVPSGTKSITSNGEQDIAQYQNVDVNVPSTVHTGTYTPQTNKSNNDMGTSHTYRYVDTSGMITPSGTKSITANGNSIDVKSYSAVNVNVPTGTTHTGTYTPAANKSNNDMGASHSYRYVNTLGMYVPSGTLQITSNGEKDVSQYQKVNVNISNSGYATTGEAFLGYLKSAYWTCYKVSGVNQKCRIGEDLLLLSNMDFSNIDTVTFKIENGPVQSSDTPVPYVEIKIFGQTYVSEYSSTNYRQTASFTNNSTSTKTTFEIRTSNNSSSIPTSEQQYIYAVNFYIKVDSYTLKS